MIGPSVPALLSVDFRTSEKLLLLFPSRTGAWRPARSEWVAILALARVMEADFIAVTQPSDDDKDSEYRRSDSDTLRGGE